MTVELKPQLEQFVQDQVQTGRYSSPADVIAAAIAHLMQDDNSDFEPGELQTLAAQGRQARVVHGSRHMRQIFSSDP